MRQEQIVYSICDCVKSFQDRYENRWLSKSKNVRTVGLD